MQKTKCRNLLTIENYYYKLKMERMFAIFKVREGDFFMSNRELELIKLIREHDDPEGALETAANIILAFLKQHESFEEQVPACLLVSS